jgi:UPF0716 protein FxsA
LFFSFLVFVAVEIAAFVAVAEQIGLLWAFALVILISALGPFVVKRVGLSVLSHTQARIARGELPTRELLDGLVVLFGGLLICVPGFVGDAVGVLLMFGPVRALVIRLSGRQLARRVGTIRTGRWQVIDVESRPVDERTPLGSGILEPPRNPEESR